MPAKESKQAAFYIPHAIKKLCRDCAHYRANSCTEVQGTIAPDASCKYYEKGGKKK